MAAGAWVVHDKYKEYEGDGTVDVDNDTFKMGLALSTSNVGTTSVDGYATLTNLVSGNGYAEDTLAVTWVEVTGTVTFGSDNGVFTASGGDITARYAFIYDDTAAGKPVVAHCLLDDTPQDVTVTDGNSLTVNVGAGVFTKA